MNIYTILINWRQPLCTLEAVSAIEKQTLKSKIIVVDNGSADDSDLLLERYLSKEVILIKLDKNYGFGSGCNSGIKCALMNGADFIWLLNNDALPESNCLEMMIQEFSKNECIGLVGAIIKDNTNIIKDHSGSFMNPLTLSVKNTYLSDKINSSEYSWITGACMLLSCKLINSVGFFDEDFFMYWEDADFCQRARLAGYVLAVSENAIVYHTAGTSSNDLKLDRFEWHLKSQIRWVRKNYKWKYYGMVCIFVRHSLKSLITFDWRRLVMTIRLIK